MGEQLTENSTIKELLARIRSIELAAGEVCLLSEGTDIAACDEANLMLLLQTEINKFLQ